MDYKRLGKRIREERQPLERKQMAVNVLRTIFSYFEDKDT